MPLARAHAGEHRILVHACIVDHDLERAVRQHRLYGGAARRFIGHVKNHGARRVAGLVQLRRQGRRQRAVRVPMHVHKMAGGSQTPAYCSTDFAAAAGDECTLPLLAHVCVR